MKSIVLYDISSCQTAHSYSESLNTMFQTLEGAKYSLGRLPKIYQKESKIYKITVEEVEG